MRSPDYMYTLFNNWALRWVDSISCVRRELEAQNWTTAHAHALLFKRLLLLRARCAANLRIHAKFSASQRILRWEESIYAKKKLADRVTGKLQGAKLEKLHGFFFARTIIGMSSGMFPPFSSFLLISPSKSGMHREIIGKLSGNDLFYWKINGNEWASLIPIDNKNMTTRTRSQ